MPDKETIKAAMKGNNPDKKKKSKLKGDKEISNPYGYSGIRTEKGDNDNPKESEAITNMVDYMKNNWPPEAASPSNVYRPKFSHITMAYNRKKKQSDA